MLFYAEEMVEPLSRISPKNPASGQRSGIFFCWVHLMTVIIYGYTLPETKQFAHATKPFQKRKVFQPSIFRCYVSFREGISFKLWKYWCAPPFTLTQTDQTGFKYPLWTPHKSFNRRLRNEVDLSWWRVRLLLNEWDDDPRKRYE